MRRIFSIDYPGELGEMWLNKDNLMACLSRYCHGVEFTVEDLTDDVLALKGDSGDALESFKAEHAAFVTAEEALAQFRDAKSDVIKKFHGTS